MEHLHANVLSWPYLSFHGHVHEGLFPKYWEDLIKKHLVVMVSKQSGVSS
jgi:hypothetical protein